MNAVEFTHWSASRFMTWELCPTEFERVYVRGEREEPSEAMLFGSAVHQGLEAHYNGADGVAAFRMAWKGFRPPGYDEELTAVGMDLVELVQAQGWSGKPEYVFTFDTSAAWGCPTVGAIDLISVDQGSIVVRDFKTTTGSWGWDRARRDPWQPVLYSWAVHDLYGIWPSFEYVILGKVRRDLTIFHLEPDEVVAMEEGLQDRAEPIVRGHRDGRYECNGKHAWCLECGEKWKHGHVCNMNVHSPRIASLTRP